MMDDKNSDRAHLEYIANKIKKYAQFIKYKLSKKKATPFLAATVIKQAIQAIMQYGMSNTFMLDTDLQNRF